MSFELWIPDLHVNGNGLAEKIWRIAIYHGLHITYAEDHTISFGLLVLDSWYQVVRSVVFQFHLSGEERSSFGSINTSDIETTKNRRLINS